MASTVVTPSSVTGVMTNSGAARVGGAAMSPSEVNNIRITKVMLRLSLHIRSHVANGTSQAEEFINLSHSLARGIDFAVAQHEVPERAQELPSLLKQICQWNSNDTQLLADIMVLMISVKSACLSGWFSDIDTEQLMNLADEIGSNFGIVPKLNTDPSSSSSVLSTIMSRFYPRLKMGHILNLFEAKPGYEAYVSDFQISKSLRSAPEEKLRLFVVQTDSLETSSCLISPPKVNFLLNGNGVERRNNYFMDTGPQVPTVVKHLLKYGSNLLQAVGEFNGNYIIAVAQMSDVPSPGSDVLEDYMQRAPLDSDPDIIEGPSRISLNCPISFTRIQTPVKGHSCNHIQCFDFHNYVDINSRRPSWRCPHCNQPVCFTDIRVDQKMVKILKEVGPKVIDIIVSSDGSWKSAMETDDASQKPESRTSNEDDSEKVSLPSTPMDVLDLTQTDDIMDDAAFHEAEDRKFDPAVSQNESSVPSTVAAAQPHVPPSTSANNGDNFWSGVYLSTFGVGSSNNVQPNTNYAPNRETEVFHGNALATTPVPRSETSLPMQQHQYSGTPPAVTNEYGVYPHLQPRNVTRTPVAVQALPAGQIPYSITQQRPTISIPNTFVRHSLSPVSHASPVPPMNINSTIRSNPHAQMPSAPMNQYPMLQPQRNVGLQTPNQVLNAAYQNPSQHMANTRMLQPQTTNPSPRSIQSSSPSFSRTQSHAGALQQERGTYNPASSQIAAANRAAQMSIDPSRTMLPPTYQMNSSPVGLRMPLPGDQRGNMGVTPPPHMRNDSYETPDQNWRPAGRMRGALTGQAYSDAMNQFIIRPNQQAQAQAARPMPNVPANVPPRVAQGSPAPSYSAAGPPSRPPGM